MPGRHTLLIFVLISATIAGCGKPVPAKHDPAPAAAVEPTVVERAPAARKKPGITEAAQIANLIDPAKLATLRERGANPRILKITAILITAKASGKNPLEIVNGAVAQIGWQDTDKGRLTAAAILRNLEIAEELGATTPEDIIEMKKGQSPIVRKGQSTGDILSVDHVLPVAVAPELSNCIANLELMPLRANQSKGDSVGPRQRSLAREFHAAGLLKSPGLVE